MHIVEPLKTAFKTVFHDVWDYVVFGYNAGVVGVMSLIDVEAHLKIMIGIVLSLLGIVIMALNIHRKYIENRRKQMENTVYRYEVLESVHVAKTFLSEEEEDLERRLKEIRKRKEEADDDIKKLSK